ncbi:hypothetical protein HDU76_010797 [Blyttiomyces sp. JEL0837]|nr:hypothetical protein HDU76_010797 [Blyttiomyces sp. JEL0837]
MLSSRALSLESELPPSSSPAKKRNSLMAAFMKGSGGGGDGVQLTSSSNEKFTASSSHSSSSVPLTKHSLHEVVTTTSAEERQHNPVIHTGETAQQGIKEQIEGRQEAEVGEYSIGDIGAGGDSLPGQSSPLPSSIQIGHMQGTKDYSNANPPLSPSPGIRKSASASFSQSNANGNSPSRPFGIPLSPRFQWKSSKKQEQQQQQTSATSIIPMPSPLPNPPDVNSAEAPSSPTSSSTRSGGLSIWLNRNLSRSSSVFRSLKGDGGGSGNGNTANEVIDVVPLGSTGSIQSDGLSTPVDVNPHQISGDVPEPAADKGNPLGTLGAEEDVDTAGHAPRVVVTMADEVKAGSPTKVELLNGSPEIHLLPTADTPSPSTSSIAAAAENSSTPLSTSPQSPSPIGTVNAPTTSPYPISSTAPIPIPTPLRSALSTNLMKLSPHDPTTEGMVPQSRNKDRHVHWAPFPPRLRDERRAAALAAAASGSGGDGRRVGVGLPPGSPLAALFSLALYQDEAEGENDGNDDGDEDGEDKDDGFGGSRGLATGLTAHSPSKYVAGGIVSLTSSSSGSPSRRSGSIVVGGGSLDAARREMGAGLDKGKDGAGVRRGNVMLRIPGQYLARSSPGSGNISESVEKRDSGIVDPDRIFPYEADPASDPNVYLPRTSTLPRQRTARKQSGSSSIADDSTDATKVMSERETEALGRSSTGYRAIDADGDNEDVVWAPVLIQNSGGMLTIPLDILGTSSDTSSSEILSDTSSESEEQLFIDSSSSQVEALRRVRSRIPNALHRDLHNVDLPLGRTGTLGPTASGSASGVAAGARSNRPVARRQNELPLTNDHIFFKTALTTPSSTSLLSDRPDGTVQSPTEEEHREPDSTPAVPALIPDPVRLFSYTTDIRFTESPQTSEDGVDDRARSTFGSRHNSGSGSEMARQGSVDVVRRHRTLSPVSLSSRSASASASSSARRSLSPTLNAAGRLPVGAFGSMALLIGSPKAVAMSGIVGNSSGAVIGDGDSVGRGRGRTRAGSLERGQWGAVIADAEGSGSGEVTETSSDDSMD